MPAACGGVGIFIFQPYGLLYGDYNFNPDAPFSHRVDFY
jgi:hypothetical protein